MSERAPDGPYVYQPYGEYGPHARTDGRLWSVGGLPPMTRDEAERVLAAIRRVLAQTEGAR
jgi:hypothetical protein